MAATFAFMSMPIVEVAISIAIKAATSIVVAASALADAISTISIGGTIIRCSVC